jgi:peptide/nickel transport system ATP-binding protein
VSALLETSDLHVRFGPVRAVDGVSFALPEGPFGLGLVGESGSGKTTIGRAVCRLVPVAQGEIRLAGEDIVPLKRGRLRRLRRTVQIVLQDPDGTLDPRMRIGTTLREVLRTHKVVPRAGVDARIEELLGEVGLEPMHAGRLPHQLSGGQKQRVMIAMALACDPDLVVADEPTTALDVMVQAQVLNVLSTLVREREVGMMMISHDLSVLAELCDRITVMYAGRVIESGPAGQVFTAPLHPYADALSAAFPRVGDPASRFAPAGLPGDPPDPRNLTQGCSFAPRCTRAADECLPAEPPLTTYAEGRQAACVRIGQ